MENIGKPESSISNNEFFQIINKAQQEFQTYLELSETIEEDQELLFASTPRDINFPLTLIVG